MAVRQVADASGGAAPMLDGLGVDRGMPRIAGEGDPAYRLRLRTLPDTVSPGAVDRAVSSIFAPYGKAHDLVETFEMTYQTCWDAPGDPIAANPDYDPSLCCYDDPRDPVPFRNRWLDAVEHRAAFIVVVPTIGAIEDVGMAYDDPATDSAGHVSPDSGGRRAYAAFDVPATFSSVLGLQGGYDGFDLPLQAVYLGTWQAIQSVRAAGVAAVVEREGE
jgi:hypothetical protein